MLHEPVDEVVRFLSVCDDGKTAVLPLEKRTGVRHDGGQEAGLALGEPKGFEASGALGDDVAEAEEAHTITP